MTPTKILIGQAFIVMLIILGALLIQWIVRMILTFS